jgi:hypothetical protein
VQASLPAPNSAIDHINLNDPQLAPALRFTTPQPVLPRRRRTAGETFQKIFVPTVSESQPTQRRGHTNGDANRQKQLDSKKHQIENCRKIQLSPAVLGPLGYDPLRRMPP